MGWENGSAVRTHVALTENLGPILTTYIRQLATMYNFDSRGSNVHFQPPKIPALTSIHVHIGQRFYYRRKKAN